MRRKKFAVGTFVKDKDDEYYRIVSQRGSWYECSRWCCMFSFGDNLDFRWGWSSTIHGLKCAKVHEMTKISKLEVLVVLGKAAVDGS